MDKVKSYPKFTQSYQQPSTKNGWLSTPVFRIAPGAQHKKKARFVRYDF